MDPDALDVATSESAASPSLPPPTRRPMAQGCATSPQQLAIDLQGSVALGDVNRIAESFDWAGMGNTQAQMIMGRLAQIAQRPVRDSEYFDASSSVGAFADASEGSHGDTSSGQMQVTFDAGNGPSIVDFQVRRYKGCYFLRF
ncbi:MAG: hypothetical protein M3R16_00505 [Pseudomonadota bacterium]|nr:hypothetical protein [Pseudomonadota bacterium]